MRNLYFVNVEPSFYLPALEWTISPQTENVFHTNADMKDYTFIVRMSRFTPGYSRKYVNCFFWNGNMLNSRNVLVEFDFELCI